MYNTAIMFQESCDNDRFLQTTKNKYACKPSQSL